MLHSPEHHRRDTVKDFMKKTLAFLKALSRNNNREWFEKNRDAYEASNEEVKNLSQVLEGLIGEFDELDPQGTHIYRIYRDVRFSKNKIPYKTTRSMSFKREGAHRRGGYYLQISPGETFLASGFWGPEPADLLHIRQQLAQDHETLEKIITEKAFVNYFGELRGDKLKTAPKGFPKDHEAVELLRYKQFIVTHPFSDEEVLSNEFPEKVAEGFRKVQPFLTHMTELLTTDLNGTPLVNL